MILTILLTFSSIVFILEICAYAIYGKEQFFSSQLGLMISTEFLVVAFINLFAALRIKRNFLSYLSSFMFLLYGAASFGSNSIVFSICELVKGNRNSLMELFKLYTWKCDNVFINALGVAFSLACFAISVGVSIHIRKFNKLQNGRNFYKAEKCFKIISIVISAVIIFIYASVIYSPYGYDNDFAKMDSYEGFYLIESDEKFAAEEITNYQDIFIRFNYDFYRNANLSMAYSYSGDLYDEDEHLEASSYKPQYKKYDDLNHDVLYKTEKIVATFRTNKKYVMIVPMLERFNDNYETEYYPDFSKGEWIEASKETVIKTKDREYRHGGAFLEYEIKIIPN